MSDDHHHHQRADGSVQHVQATTDGQHDVDLRLRRTTLHHDLLTAWHAAGIFRPLSYTAGVLLIDYLVRARPAGPNRLGLELPTLKESGEAIGISKQSFKRTRDQLLDAGLLAPSPAGGRRHLLFASREDRDRFLRDPQGRLFSAGEGDSAPQNQAQGAGDRGSAPNFGAPQNGARCSSAPQNGALGEKIGVAAPNFGAQDGESAPQNGALGGGKGGEAATATAAAAGAAVENPDRAEAVWEAITAAGIDGKARERLAQLPGITVELVDRVAARCREKGLSDGVTICKIQKDVETRQARLRRAARKQAQAEGAAQGPRPGQAAKADAAISQAEASAIIAGLSDEDLGRLRELAIDRVNPAVAPTWRKLGDLRGPGGWGLKFAVAELARREPAKAEGRPQRAGPGH